MRAAQLFVALLAMTAIASCGGEGLGLSENGEPGPEGTDRAFQEAGKGLPCEVFTVFKKACSQCHGPTPQFGAPMSLMSLEDLHRPSRQPNETVYQRVKGRIHDDRSPMPAPPYPRLGAADLATLDQWIDAGAPAALDGGCTGLPAPPGLEPLSCSADLHLRPTSPWKMPDNQPDETVCYGVSLTASAKRHLIAFGPKLDNTRLLHHIALYKADLPMSGTPAPCNVLLSAAWRLAAGWAPGIGNFYLPEAAGMPDEGTTNWIVQIHYHNFQMLKGQTDATGYDICSTSTLRPNDADVLTLGTQTVAILPQTMTTIACDWTVPLGSNFKIFGAAPHMHQLGYSLDSVALGPLGSGTPTTIVSDPAYQYANQRIHPANNDIQNLQVLRTTCVWRNDTNRLVTWGPTTTDEMCNNTVYYYPKITLPGWNFSLPSIVAPCTVNAQPVR